MRIRAILRFRNEDLTRKRLIAGFKTQEELAAYLEICTTSVSGWETFKTYPKDERIIKKLEAALNCKIEEIFPPEAIEAINKKLGTPIEKVADIKRLPSYTRGEYLLPSPEDMFERKELEENVENWLESISERERKVLEMRFGLADGIAHTLEEVGQEFGVTRERIRQIEAKALDKIREDGGLKKLRDY